VSVRTFVILFYYGSGSASGTVFNYCSGSDFLARYGSSSGSGNARQKVTVPTVPVPQRCTSGEVIVNSSIEFASVLLNTCYIEEGRG
jgi:hypothetical protein